MAYVFPKETATLSVNALQASRVYFVNLVRCFLSLNTMDHVLYDVIVRNVKISNGVIGLNCIRCYFCFRALSTQQGGYDARYKSLVLLLLLLVIKYISILKIT